MSFYKDNSKKIVRFMRDYRVNSVVPRGLRICRRIQYNPNDADRIRNIVEIPYEGDTRIGLFEEYSTRCVSFAGRRVSAAQIYEDTGLCPETARTSIYGKSIRRNGRQCIQKVSPSKEVVLRLGIALRLNEREMKRFLYAFELPFPSDDRDRLITFFIRHEQYKTRFAWGYEDHAVGGIWRELQDFLRDASMDGWRINSIELNFDNPSNDI